MRALLVAVLLAAGASPAHAGEKGAGLWALGSGSIASEPQVAQGETPPHAPTAEPAAPGAAPEHGAHQDLATADCATILAAPEGGGHGEGAPPAVGDVILHHVTNSHVVEFESPVSHNSVRIDFKRLMCKAFGWNGVVGHLGSVPVDLTPTKHLFWMWIAAALLILLFVGITPKNKGDLVPRGRAAFLEMLVLFVRDEIARKNIGGKEADRYVNYLLTAFFFILVMNLLGLVPYAATATGNVSVTVALALFTFVLTQAAGIRAAGLGGWLKHLTGGVHPALWPIMIVVEFLGLFTKPFALTMRLFANMIAGHIVIFFLLGLIFILKSWGLAPVSVAFAFAIFLLEIFVALVQAYIFTMLSALFIGFGVAMGHHAEHENEPGSTDEAKHAVHH